MSELEDKKVEEKESEPVFITLLKLVAAGFMIYYGIKILS
jgi:hypothetical protein